MTIRVIGRSEYQRFAGHPFLVDVTRESAAPWSKGLSPEMLGPVKLYGGRKAQTMKNGWEFCKVLEGEVGADGQPNQQYWDRATQGWGSLESTQVDRAEFFYWEGRRLSSFDARTKVFWPMYRNAVAATPAYLHLQKMTETVPEAVLFDPCAYDEEARGLSMKEVLLDLRRPLSHAFILKSMLLHGTPVTPEDVLSNNAQISLF